MHDSAAQSADSGLHRDSAISLSAQPRAISPLSLDFDRVLTLIDRAASYRALIVKLRALSIFSGPPDSPEISSAVHRTRVAQPTMMRAAEGVANIRPSR